MNILTAYKVFKDENYPTSSFGASTFGVASSFRVGIRGTRKFLNNESKTIPYSFRSSSLKRQNVTIVYK